jgi:histidine triad (HIT) family protein
MADFDADCLFCKIAEGDIPAEIVRSDDQVVVFRDINPKAPTHLLAIPRRHIASAAELTDQDGPLLAALFGTLRDLAAEAGVGGYRIVTNVGPDAGQSVFHVHFHLLAGRSMAWPPG